MKKILICGNYGATNIGDEAILAGAAKLLNTDFDLTALSYCPKHTTAQHNIKAYYFLPFGIRSLFRGMLKGELLRTIKAISSCDLFLLGGGGLFTNEHWKAIAIWSTHVFVARALRRPIMMVAQTVEFIESPFLRWITAKVFKTARSITVRDQKSRLTLEKMGISGAKVVSDLAWLLKTSLPTSNQRKKEVIISIRPWKDYDSKIVTEITNFSRFLYAIGYTPLFMTFQTLKQNDLKLIRSITKNLESYKIPCKTVIPENPKEAMRHIGSAFATISMRLHGCVFSAICETPFIAISYAPKVKSFITHLNVAPQSIDINDFSSNRLIEKFELLCKKHSKLCHDLNRIGNKEVAQAKSNLESISSFFAQDHSK